MKAISLLQPWAGLLALGIKEFETRSRNTHYRGRIAIHSSARMPKEGKELLDWLAKNRDGFRPGDHKAQVCKALGSVLGVVDFTDSFSTNNPIEYVNNISQEESRFGDYSPDRYFYKCENPILFSRHYPAKGNLGLWNWDENELMFFDKKLLAL